MSAIEQSRPALFHVDELQVLTKVLLVVKRVAGCACVCVEIN